MPSRQEFIISVRVNVSPALYACQLSYDSSVMVLRKIVILWFAIAFFLKRCHGEGQASLQRWRGILLLNMLVGELVNRHFGQYVGKSVSPKLPSTTGERDSSRWASNYNTKMIPPARQVSGSCQDHSRLCFRREGEDKC